MKKNKNKDDLIAGFLKRQEKEKTGRIKEFCKLDERFFRYYEVVYYNDFTGLLIKRDVKTMKGLYAHLRTIRRKIGNYKIKTYWIPYDGNVQIEYTVLDKTVRYSLAIDDCEGAIKELSGGKCHVEDSISKSVVCNI